MRLLYVEDNPVDIDLTRRRLVKEAPDVQLETAGTLKEAYARLEPRNGAALDLVLVDLRLPDGDGLSLLRHIREKALPLAVVVITGTGDEDVAVAALKGGADDYVSKRQNYLAVLPLTLESALRHRAEATARQAQPLKVLYAEHDASNVDQTRRYLSEFAPHIALQVVTNDADLRARVSAAGNDEYDAILMDCHLPEFQVLEILRELRISRGLDIPVVLLTGASEEPVALRALEFGLTSYLISNPGYLQQLPRQLELAKARADELRQESALRESEARYRAVFELSVMGIAQAIPPDGRIVHVNDAFCAIVGYTREELLQKSFREITHPADRERNFEEFERLVRDEISGLETDKRYVHKDGRTIWVNVRASAVRDHTGRIIYAIAIVEDITERRKADLKFRGLLESAPEATVIFDQDANITLVNSQTENLFGYDRSEILGKPLDVLLPERFREVHSAHFAEYFADPQMRLMGIGLDLFALRKDGTEVPVEISLSPLETEEGILVIAAIRDVSERKHSEDALRQSEERFRQLTENIGAVFFIAEGFDEGLPGRLLYISAAYETIWGRSRDELYQNPRTWFENVHPEDRERLRPLLSQISKAEFNEQFRIVRPNGAVRWVHERVFPIYDQFGVIYRVAGIVEDITERKNAEGELRESEKRFRSLADTAPVLIWMSDTNIQCTYVGQTWLDFTGRTLEQELGDGWTEGVHPDDLERCMSKFATAFAARKGFRTKYRLRRRDGEYRWVLDSGVPRFTPDGDFIGYVGSALDITEQIDAERALESALLEVQQLKDQLHVENVYLQEQIMVAHNFGEIIGQSESLQRALRQAEQVAPLDTTVLLLGETGTGKELLAHAIHSLNSRKDRPLVKVNCATLPAHLIESELFGHERGAFTGALARRVGRFEISNGGTIFLDEIGELPLDLQAKLLRVLQEGEFERLGSSSTIRVDVRVLAATNRDLEEAVRKGAFRSDLYYRLNIFPIKVPPLRERQEDIPMLVIHFLKQLGMKLGKRIDSIPQATMEVLQNYPWPGNIRELRNVIERAAIVSQGPQLRLLDNLEYNLPQPEPSPAPPPPPALVVPSAETLDENQRQLIIRTLERTYWRVEGPVGAAAILGVHPNTLRSRMKKLGISKPRFKEHSG